MLKVNRRRSLSLESKLLLRLKVLFASGYTCDVVGYQALVDASSNLIQQPFTSSTLGEHVRHALDQ